MLSRGAATSARGVSLPMMLTWPALIFSPTGVWASNVFLRCPQVVGPKTAAPAHVGKIKY